MKTRWTSSLIGGAVIGMLAVGAVFVMTRNDTSRTGTIAAAPIASPPAGHTITVTGTGTTTVKPDIATISLGVQASAATATEALEQANRSAAALIAALKAAGIKDDDIATSGLSIYPQYSNSNRITGYQASNNVTVTVRSIDRTGPVIDAAAAAAGDNITVGGVSFSVADPEQVLGVARAAAIENAKKRAGEFAEAAGVEVGSVVMITELSAGQVPIYYGGERAFADGSDTPIQIGTQDLTATVTVVFELV